MRIAIIASGFLPVLDGVTVSGWERLKKLSQWGHQVLLFCPDYSSLEHLYPHWKKYTGNILPGVRAINLSSTSFFVDFERNVSRRAYQIVKQELHQFQPDIIHVDEPERMFVGFGRLPGVDFARTAAIPCVGFYRTNFLDYLDDYFSLPGWGQTPIKYLFQKFLCWVYNSYDLTLIHNRLIQNKLQEIGINNTIFGHFTGFDPAKFSPCLVEFNFFQRRYGMADIKQIKLVFLGRLTPDKGWNFTLRAFAQAARQFDLSQVSLIVVGDGSMRDEIARSLGSNVHLLGRVSHAEVPALLINSDIYITTSEKENRSLAVLEALAAGLPILAPRAGGLEQDIQDGENGLLYTPQDKDDFSNKLKMLIENPALRQEMGAKGKASVADFTWNNTVGNLVQVWEQQIQQKCC